MRSGEKDAAWIQVPNAGQQEIHARRGGNSDEGKQIGSGNDSAFGVRRGTVLDQRIYRHGEKAGKEAERRQKGGRANKRMRHHAQQSGHDRQSKRAQRDQSILNFVAGKITGYATADSYSSCQRRLQQRESDATGREKYLFRKRTPFAGKAFQ